MFDINHKFKVGLISLGCDKNRVDAEKFLSDILNMPQAQLTNEASEADVIIVNTCGFIQKAVKEGIDTILEMATYKKSGKLRLLVVTGCMAERYYSDLSSQISEIDLLIKPSNNADIPKLIADKLGISLTTHSNYNERVLSNAYNYAYLKISDGCNNHCTYCTIPSIRGAYHSYKIEDLVDEAKRLKDIYDIKELNIVAQDTTRYGFDLYGKYSLIQLLDELSKLEIDWIRLNYCYPELVDKTLIDYIDNNDKICKYIDIPLQHSENRILKLMNRLSTGDSIRKTLDLIKSTTHPLSIRSTFIIGFPSETDDEFQSLCSFLQEYKLDNAGFFAYSREENTPAYKLPLQIPYKIKQARLKEVTAIQSAIMQDKLKLELNKTIKVLCDSIDYDKGLFVGRSEGNAPEVDKRIYFTAKESVSVGEFHNIKIKKVKKLDLIGEKE